MSENGMRHMMFSELLFFEQPSYEIAEKPEYKVSSLKRR